eukprot:comp11125_c0_seq1/m.5626 comp11125_c0_seq1/g.5626  ORF comp11125_c0_seq1/g.5626 comp11125_c0_seq1/m.5626 type:complete len:213 (-) comp11125_c0_seq1:148-786(-)
MSPTSAPPLHDGLTDLHNVFFVMRHGQSEANVAGLITSTPEIACVKYGLTPLGRTQAAESAQQIKSWIEENKPNSTVEIWCSDFLRTVHTAEEAQRVFSLDKINPTPALRERFFGDYDMTSHDNYETVWADDPINSHHNNYNAESAYSVGQRAVNLIRQLEAQAPNGGKVFLLIAHGDVAQMLQAVFSSQPPGMHRTLPHLNPAGWVKLFSL